MVVEDNPGDVELLRIALDSAELAYKMTVIEDGGEAIALFRDGNHGGLDIPDVAVLDLNLPKYDGLEILEVVRSNPEFAAMPIVILSSSSSPREQSRIRRFESVRYFTKPPDFDQYLTIGRLIRDFVAESSRSAQ